MSNHLLTLFSPSKSHKVPPEQILLNLQIHPVRTRLFRHPNQSSPNQTSRLCKVKRLPRTLHTHKSFSSHSAAFPPKVNSLAVRWTLVHALRFLKSKFYSLVSGLKGGRVGRGWVGATQGTERPALLSLNHSIAHHHHQYNNRVGHMNSLPTSFHVPVYEHSSLQLTITSKTCRYASNPTHPIQTSTTDA